MARRKVSQTEKVLTTIKKVSTYVLIGFCIFIAGFTVGTYTAAKKVYDANVAESEMDAVNAIEAENVETAE